MSNAGLGASTGWAPLVNVLIHVRRNRADVYTSRAVSFTYEGHILEGGVEGDKIMARIRDTADAHYQPGDRLEIVGFTGPFAPTFDAGSYPHRSFEVRRALLLEPPLAAWSLDVVSLGQ